MKPDLKALRKEWYRKLKESGFRDIEMRNGNLRHANHKIHSYTNANACAFKSSGRRNESANQERERNKLRAELALHYFDLATDLLYHTREFKLLKLSHQKIWEMHCDGVSNFHIERAMGMCRQNVDYVLKKCRALMKKRLNEPSDG